MHGMSLFALEREMSYKGNNVESFFPFISLYLLYNESNRRYFEFLGLEYAFKTCCSIRTRKILKRKQ